MRIITDHLIPGERSWGYFMGPKMMPGYSAEQLPRMVEQYFVVRGDAIACYEVDHGCADDYQYVPPMMIPGFGDDPVEMMHDMGLRHLADERWAKRMIEYKESSTLFADVMRQEEQRHHILHNRTTIGPYQAVQRNGWSPEEVRRRYVDERERRTRKTVNVRKGRP